MKQRTKCWWGFHKWSDWYDYADAYVSNLLGQKQPALYQERICVECKKKDRQYILFKKGD